MYQQGEKLHLILKDNHWSSGPQTGTDLHLDPPFANSWNTVLRGWLVGDDIEVLPIWSKPNFLLGLWPKWDSYRSSSKETSCGFWCHPTPNLLFCNATHGALDPTMRSLIWIVCNWSSWRSSWSWLSGLPALLVHPHLASDQKSSLVWQNCERGRNHQLHGHQHHHHLALQCLQVLQAAGDTIYVPSRSAHAVLNLDWSVAVNLSQ